MLKSLGGMNTFANHYAVPLFLYIFYIYVYVLDAPRRVSAVRRKKGN